MLSVVLPCPFLVERFNKNVYLYTVYVYFLCVCVCVCVGAYMPVHVCLRARGSVYVCMLATRSAVMRFMWDHPIKGLSEQEVVSTFLKVNLIYDANRRRLCFSPAVLPVTWMFFPCPPRFPSPSAYRRVQSDEGRGVLPGAQANHS